MDEFDQRSWLGKEFRLALERPDETMSSNGQTGHPRDRMSLLSHDLRSALSDILGGVQLINKDQFDQPTLEHFDRISAAGETLARLLNKMLTDEPSTGAGMVTQPGNLNLADFLTDISRRWTDRAHEKNIKFSVVTESALPAIVTVDRVGLERVIANLVGNAIKFTDAGQVTLSVKCTEDRALNFKLTDEGPGLSDASIAKLFQYEGRPTDTPKPGTGLGLFIAKELAGMLGAELSVRNNDGVGVAAELRLPHEAWFDRSLRKSGKAPGGVSRGPVDLSAMKILLAEDNKTNQLVATQMLGAMGATFRVASDGLEALELLETESFDLALLDIEMPRMSGLELIKTVRSMPTPLCNMPLVALTAYVMREHRERIYGAGADGIIAKPLMSIEELGQAILDYYDGAKSRELPEPDPTIQDPVADDTVVDRQIFDNLVEIIGAETKAELLSKLQADTDTVAEGLTRGRQSLDLAEIRSQTHILISVAGAIGATTLQHIAQRLNAAANRREAKEVDSLCKTCLIALAELQGFILREQTIADQRP